MTIKMGQSLNFYTDLIMLILRINNEKGKSTQKTKGIKTQK